MPDINSPVFPDLASLTDATLLLGYDEAAGGTVRFSVGELKEYFGATGGGGGEDPPVEVGTPLTFANLDDTNGLVFYIGSQELTQQFQNPITAGFITADRLRRGGEDLYNPSHMTDRENKSGGSNLWYGGTAGDYFELDFGQYRLKPNWYTFKNWHNDSRHPRNWKIQFSENGISWDDFSIQVNNTTSNSAFGAVSLPIEGATKFYKKARWTVTGPNSFGSVEICLSEIEFYGRVQKVV
jgi:hypothetical protein